VCRREWGAEVCGRGRRLERVGSGGVVWEREMVGREWRVEGCVKRVGSGGVWDREKVGEWGAEGCVERVGSGGVCGRERGAEVCGRGRRLERVESGGMWYERGGRREGGGWMEGGQF
jgi:hypothetical protein